MRPRRTRTNPHRWVPTHIDHAEALRVYEQTTDHGEKVVCDQVAGAYACNVGLTQHTRELFRRAITNADYAARKQGSN